MFCLSILVLLRIAIAALWLLRRAVIQEVATRVKEQLEELGDLEGQVRAREDAKNILEEVEEIAEAVENEAENLQQEMGRERETYPGLFLPLLNQKSNYRITDKIQKLHQNLEQLG